MINNNAQEANQSPRRLDAAAIKDFNRTSPKRSRTFIQDAESLDLDDPYSMRDEGRADLNFVYQSHFLFQRSFQLEQTKYKQQLKRSFQQMLRRIPQDILIMKASDFVQQASTSDDFELNNNIQFESVDNSAFCLLSSLKALIPTNGEQQQTSQAHNLLTQSGSPQKNYSFENKAVQKETKNQEIQCKFSQRISMPAVHNQIDSQVQTIHKEEQEVSIQTAVVQTKEARTSPEAKIKVEHQEQSIQCEEQDKYKNEIAIQCDQKLDSEQNFQNISSPRSKLTLQFLEVEEAKEKSSTPRSQSSLRQRESFRSCVLTRTQYRKSLSPDQADHAHLIEDNAPSQSKAREFHIQVDDLNSREDHDKENQEALQTAHKPVKSAVGRTKGRAKAKKGGAGKKKGKAKKT